MSTWSWWSGGGRSSRALWPASRATGGRSRLRPRSRRGGGRTRPPSLLFRRCFLLFLLLLLPLFVHGLTVLFFRRCFHCFATLFAAIICTLLFRPIYFASLLLLFRCRLFFLCRFFCRFRTVFRFFFLLFRLFLLYLLRLVIVFGRFLSLFIINFSISPCL